MFYPYWREMEISMSMRDGGEKVFWNGASDECVFGCSFHTV